MFANFKFTLEYKLSLSGKTIKASGNDTGYYKIETENIENGISVKLVPKTKLFLINAYLEYEQSYAPTDKVYVNGYQSWTTSREFGVNEVQEGLRGVMKYLYPFQKLATIFGDYDFQHYSFKKGRFHSYSYTYIKQDAGIKLLGTLSERNGFTIFHHDTNNKTLTVQKDVEGVVINTEYPIFDIVCIEDSYDKAFERYFSQLNLPELKHKHMTGYTSWYNYYGKITEDIISRDIDGLATIGEKADIFQIDDGYQIATGDWTTVKKKKFPNGMKFLADKIHSKGYKAGLWLAPFCAQLHSKVAKEHKDWFIINPKNDKREIGCIAWNGAYTLDFYKEEPRNYIKNFFNVVLNEWGFDMVKLDFLYSICRTPRYGKSRGQIMCEGMDFLRECVGEKLLLGCGVPLFPCFGKVDFCRISCDVAPYYKDSFLVKNSNQEVFSSRNAMNNTIFRRHLDGKAFVNDPDVFYVRKSNLKGIDPLTVKKSKLDYTQEQKEMLALINNMFGNVLFVSDNVGDFDEKQRELLLKTFAASNKKVIDANYMSADDIEIIYEENGKKYKLCFNIETSERTI
ncbi:MAG TPA: glycoside hydrolase family 36 protein, partial [Clostridia bacterium]|nr:glycoside hydrolase family 36 protein [Clostridia bacterium]